MRGLTIPILEAGGDTAAEIARALGEKAWKREVLRAVLSLKKSFIADYVVLGGGNVHRFDQLPEGIERGKNENAFLGGVRLWETKDGGERKWQIF